MRVAQTCSAYRSSIPDRNGRFCRTLVCDLLYYEETVVGSYVADLIAEGKVLIELKAASGIEDIHMAQCLNYLRATGMSVCLLINFGTPKIQIKRIVNNL